MTLPKHSTRREKLSSYHESGCVCKAFRVSFAVMLALLLTHESIAFSAISAGHDTTCGHFRSQKSGKERAAWKGRTAWKDRSVMHMSMWNKSPEEDLLLVSNRLKACIPYVLPLLDGDQFGHFVYGRIPPLAFLDSILLAPLVRSFEGFPLLGLALFVMFSLGTTRNDNLVKVVRFNAQQAVLLDLALIFPILIKDALVECGDAVPLGLLEFCENFVWYAIMFAVVYCVNSNLRGKKPDGLGWISGAAELVTGPF